MSKPEETKNEITPTQTTQLTPVMPLMTAQEAKQAWQKFEDLKAAVLTNADYQDIAGKTYIKRSGFRKLAVFFGISDKILTEERKDRTDGSFIWRIKVEVTAPNGRSAIGVGACDSAEREGKGRGGGFAHPEHDVYSTAHTRAKSRAISDLVAGGVVSAEEMEAEATVPHSQSVDVKAQVQGWVACVPTDKGPWDRNNDLGSDEIQNLLAMMNAEDKTSIDYDGFRFWQLKDGDKVTGLGRRVITK